MGEGSLTMTTNTNEYTRAYENLYRIRAAVEVAIGSVLIIGIIHAALSGISLVSDIWRTLSSVLTVVFAITAVAVGVVSFTSAARREWAHIALIVFATVVASLLFLHGLKSGFWTAAVFGPILYVVFVAVSLILSIRILRKSS
ncbi:MAG: hypothetical protein V1748_07330 [Actinomycetota bacterium]